MNWAELPKEKKQIVILGVLSVITVLFLVTNLVVKPAKEKFAIASTKYKEIEPKVRSAERLVKQDIKNKKALLTASERILKISREHMPPDESTFAWALAQIDDLGKRLGVTLRVDTQNRARYQKLPLKTDYKNLRNNLPMYIPYTVKVNSRCSYQQAKEVLFEIQKQYPYASISRLSITTSEDPENHNVSFDVEWPIFRRIGDRQELEQIASGKA